MIFRILKEAIEKSPKSILLLGPRQVGKSTLIHSLKPDLSINLNDESTYLDFKSNPSELLQRLQGQNIHSVFIDEIQRHPSLLNTIQTLLDDKNQKFKFFLTGSSARKLKRGHANLLPGRIFSYEMSALCAAELQYKLDVTKALSYGTLPEPYLEPSEKVAEKLLQTYSGVYLKEEIQAEALTRNLEGYSRFLLAAATSSGLVLDFSKIAKQAKIERKICSRFFEILEDTLIAQRVDVFEETSADIVKRPKFYFFDTGVLNGLLQNFNTSNDRKGFLFEHLVFNQIINSAKARDQKVEVFYFRTRGGYEVDFILRTAGRTYGVEVKSGNFDHLDAEKILRLNDFMTFDGLYLVTMDSVSKNMGDVKVRSLNKFLQEVGL